MVLKTQHFIMTHFYLVASGNFRDAFKLSKEMYDLDLRSPALGLVLITKKIKDELNESVSLIERFDKDLLQFSLFSKGWINLKQGNLEDSLVEFNKLSESSFLILVRIIHLLHIC